MPIRIFTINPMTRAICIRFLNEKVRYQSWPATIKIDYTHE